MRWWVAVVGALVALGPSTSIATAGTRSYTFTTNVRTCYVAVALVKGQPPTTGVMFNTMGYSGGLSSCSAPSVSGPAAKLDQADGQVDLYNVSSGQEVSGSQKSFYCRITTTCRASGSATVLRNGNTYVARTELNLWLDGSSWCSRYAVDSKGHRYCAAYDSERWVSVPSGCYISYGLVSCNFYRLTSTTETATIP
jgi:hypothetical protein